MSRIVRAIDAGGDSPVLSITSFCRASHCWKIVHGPAYKACKCSMRLHGAMGAMPLASFLRSARLLFHRRPATSKEHDDEEQSTSREFDDR
ncbi:hypothetical protein [Cupriavidus gilardii]|uniref:hypothetical protein n=1 Tax=Cupriavidus gilardii TaxID=82541 RepID=UPI00157368E9|nr:hypothetical protein [Cupriavidus gilardii]NSX02918.1 hypothetical protein [Cupriavidus gilardii]